MRILYCGNFVPPHSTENHVARALEHNGHEVVRIQENVVDNWDHLANGGMGLSECDWALWTRTGWDWPHLGISHEDARLLQSKFLLSAARLKKPTVGYHLDRWVGLARESQLDVEPYFNVDVMITADGGHQEDFTRRGINHEWFPPGVSLAECEPGMFRSDLASPLAFVGSHDGGYHREHQHRFQLVEWLQQNFRRDCAFWPRPGDHALRGQDLRDLYASTEVNVGDSAFAGDGVGFYCSDRVPETLGRGGFLLHPDVPGVTDGSDWRYGPMWASGTHLTTWAAGDWDALGKAIQWALDNPSDRREIAMSGRAFTVENHTYEVRAQQLVTFLTEGGLLRAKRKGKTIR